MSRQPSQWIDPCRCMSIYDARSKLLPHERSLAIDHNSKLQQRKAAVTGVFLTETRNVGDYVGSKVSTVKLIDQMRGTVVNSTRTRISDPAPLDYIAPPFPSLYWPYKARPGVANYLYYVGDVWRFTLLWTLIIYAAFHLAAAALAVCMQVGKGKNAFKWVWTIPVAYASIAGIEALIAGSIVGLMYVPLGSSTCLANKGQDWVQFTMQATSACQHGYLSYGL